MVAPPVTAESVAVSDTYEAQEEVVSQELGPLPLRLFVNGKNVDVKVDVRTTFLGCQRETLPLTGTKKAAIMACLASITKFRQRHL